MQAIVRHMIMRMFLIVLLLVSGCGRRLTDNETAHLQTLFGDDLNTQHVRLVEGAPVAAVTFRRKARPRVTCRERILPPVKEEIVTAKPAAMTLFNTAFFVPDWYVDDYMRGYPDRMNLAAAMLLSHEMTHVWQWQNRKVTGYSPLRAVAEHGNSADPYLFELDGAPNFLKFGYEQQGAIMEEYVCCRALAPEAARTRRLHDMLRDVMPVADLPRDGRRERAVQMPWKGAELNGICA